MAAAVETRDLVKAYPGVRAVDGVSLAIPEGEVFGFLGPNGAGKTTTILILATLLRPTSGEARVDGHDVVREPDRVRRSIGYIPQQLTVEDNLTGRENLLILAKLVDVPRAERAGRIGEALRAVGLEERAGEPVGHYSGGMKRRLELAGAFLHRPRVLFLDEPTLGLDPQTRGYIWEYLQGIRRKHGTTIFLTTHYMEEAERVCDRIAIIDRGRIAAVGSPAELRRGLPQRRVVLQLEAPPGARLPEGPGLRVEGAGDGNATVAAESVQAAEALLADLLPRGFRLRGIEAEGAHLEDVFLHYTGRSLREERGPGPPAGSRMARRAFRMRR